MKEVLEIAKKEIGVKEIQGGENPRILEYHKACTLKAKEDEIPWCSAFVNWCLDQVGIKGTNLANASSFLEWGEELKQPIEGCVVVIKSSKTNSGYHVGFFNGFEGNYVKVIGGNQSDQVKESYFLKKNVVSYRG